MANIINTVKDAENLNRAIFYAREILAPVAFKQAEEDKIVFTILVDTTKPTSLSFLSGYEVKILGTKSWSFLGEVMKDRLEVQVEVTIDSDWELEHDIAPILASYGYLQPTDLRRQKKAE